MDADPGAGSLGFQLAVLVILTLINAFFAGSEMAVVSVNKIKIRKLAEEGNRKAKLIDSLSGDSTKFLSTIQVAITLAGFLQSAFAADNFAGPLVQLLIDSGVSMHEGVLRTICVFLITLVLSYFNLVFGELVPKRIAMKKSESLALGMAKMLYFVSKVCAPLVWILTISTNGMLRLLRINPNEEADTVTEEEIRMLLAEGNEKGIIQAEENEMIQNIFEFDDIPVDQICTHRRDVVYLSTSDTPEEWEKIIKDNRHTYYPVCGDDLDDVIGILDTKDYFRSENRSKDYVMENVHIQIPPRRMVMRLYETYASSRLWTEGGKKREFVEYLMRLLSFYRRIPEYNCYQPCEFPTADISKITVQNAEFWQYFLMTGYDSRGGEEISPLRRFIHRIYQPSAEWRKQFCRYQEEKEYCVFAIQIG